MTKLSEYGVEVNPAFFEELSQEVLALPAMETFSTISLEITRELVSYNGQKAIRDVRKNEDGSVSLQSLMIGQYVQEQVSKNDLILFTKEDKQLIFSPHNEEDFAKITPEELLYFVNGKAMSERNFKKQQISRMMNQQFK